MADIDFGDLEIGLSSLGGNRYRVEMRFVPPRFDLDSRQDEMLPPRATGEMLLIPDELLNLTPDEYSRALGASLFGSPSVRSLFDVARAATFAFQKAARGLRVRFWTDRATEQQLQRIQWETLCDPSGDDQNRPLTIQTLVPFSRVMELSSIRRVRLQPRGELKALVIIANPPMKRDGADISVDVGAEWANAKAALKTEPPLPVTLVARHPDADGRLPTFETILHELAMGYDIVYLICHGSQQPDGTYLYLETETGARHDILATELADFLGSAEIKPPRLFVLTACQSAGSGLSTDNSAHLSIGPALVRSGVPAVLAMNGRVRQDTVAEFMPAFFESLLAEDSGFVDRAMNVARLTVRTSGNDGWWRPVLYMRLQAGRIWSVPYLTEGGKEPFDALSTSFSNGKCIPVIGPGLLEPVWGSSRWIAHKWADRFGFPLAPHQSDELPSVAQFMDRRLQGSVAAGYAAGTWLIAIEEVLQRQCEKFDCRVQIEPGTPANKRVRQRVTAVGTQLRGNPNDPYRTLARLPASVYLTATPDPLLAQALAANGRRPLVEFARWQPKLQREIEPSRPPVMDDSFYDDPVDPLARRFTDETLKFWLPSAKHPLVFHLFGTLDALDSLVVTEDDFFNYLSSVFGPDGTKVIPTAVRGWWADQALMLLGFDLDDWSFRALHRAVTDAKWASRGNRPLSAAAQLYPEEDRNLRPGAALRYLEDVFKSDQIAISWGDPKQFLDKLWKQLSPNDVFPDLIGTDHEPSAEQRSAVAGRR